MVTRVPTASDQDNAWQEYVTGLKWGMCPALGGSPCSDCRDLRASFTAGWTAALIAAGSARPASIHGVTG